MSHPPREDWVAYLYGELDSAKRSALTTHLRECAECRVRVDEWRTTMWALSAWEVDDQGRRIRPLWLRWSGIAAAAALIFVAGIVVSRFVAPPRIDVEALRVQVAASVRSDLEPILREQLRDELRDEMRPTLALMQRRLYTTLYAELYGDVAAMGGQILATTDAETDRRMAAFAEAYHAEQDAERETILNALRQIERRRSAEYARLVRDLEALADVTGDEFERTHERIREVVAYAATQSERNPTRPND